MHRRLRLKLGRRATTERSQALHVGVFAASAPRPVSSAAGAGTVLSGSGFVAADAQESVLDGGSPITEGNGAAESDIPI